MNTYKIFSSHIEMNAINAQGHFFWTSEEDGDILFILRQLKSDLLLISFDSFSFGRYRNIIRCLDDILDMCQISSADNLYLTRLLRDILALFKFRTNKRFRVIVED